MLQTPCFFFGCCLGKNFQSQDYISTFIFRVSDGKVALLPRSWSLRGRSRFHVVVPLALGYFSMVVASELSSSFDIGLSLLKRGIYCGGIVELQ